MYVTTYHLVASHEAAWGSARAFHGGTAAEAERLIRSIQYVKSPAASQEIDLATGGARPETVAHLLASGRLVLLEERRELWAGASKSDDTDPVVPPVPPIDPVTERDWIEVELIDADGRPMPGELCKVQKTDGTTLQRALDSAGKLRIDGIPTGTCMISFPALGGGGPAPAPSGSPA